MAAAHVSVAPPAKPPRMWTLASGSGGGDPNDATTTTAKAAVSETQRAGNAEAGTAPSVKPANNGAATADAETIKRQLHFRSPLAERRSTATGAANATHHIGGASARRPRRHKRLSRAVRRSTDDENAGRICLAAADAARDLAGGEARARHCRRQRLALGCSSLMHACQRGDFPAVLEQLRTQPERLRQVDGRRKNALHYCAAQRAEQRDLVAAASIAVAAPELLGSADEDGFTPLHLAVIQGNLAMVNLLLANKADVNAVDNEGHSVVHWATVCGEVEALRSVLAAGANVATPDINGGSPLHYAAQMCGASYDGKPAQAGNSSKLALEILAILLGHPQASVDVQDKDGRQPLLWAASAGSAKAVIALVKAGARVESADKDGLTALHCAASRGHTECIDTLISLCGAPTDLIDANGCTALHYAVTLGHADATSRLLDLEADPNRQDRKGRTPAHCGCSKGQFETAKLLKEGGANLWLRNAKGDLPVHEAAASGRRELVEWLLQQRPKQANTTSNDGRSMLHIAAANDFTDMCKTLLDYGADVNGVYRNSRGLVITPLDCALQKGNRSTAKFLQSNGGLPAGKLRLAARRPNPFQDADAVRPLQYADKEEVQDLRHSKKYVVYLKRSDADGGAAELSCSCTEQTYKKEQRYAHTCRRHRRSRRRPLRRRTSSCGEAKELQRGTDAGDSGGDISRSKSYVEIRPGRGRGGRCASSSEADEGEGGDSCENCCYHRRQKQRVLRRRSLSLRRSRDSKDSERDDGAGSFPQQPHDGEHVVKVELQVSDAANARPQSATKRQPAAATGLAGKEGTFVLSPPPSAQPVAAAANDVVDPTDDETHAQEAEVITTQVDVHREADTASVTTPPDEVGPAGEGADGGAERKPVASAAHDQVVEQKVQAAAKVDLAAPPDAIEPLQNEMNLEKEMEQEASLLMPRVAEPPPAVVETLATPVPSPLPSPGPAGNGSAANAQIATPSLPAPSTAEDAPSTVAEEKAPPPVPISQETANAVAIAARKEEYQSQQRDQESRRSFTLLPSDSAEEEVEDDDEDEEDAADDPNGSRKSSFQILKSDDSVGEIDDALHGGGVDFNGSHVFKVVSPPDRNATGPSDVEQSGAAGGGEHSHAGGGAAVGGNFVRYEEDGQESVGPQDVFDYTTGTSRKRRLRRRVKSGGGRARGSSWKPPEAGEAAADVAAQQSTKDQDSGFEPSPRTSKTKIPTPRHAHTAPRRPIYAGTLDGRSCSSRFENRKLGDRGACDMSAVTRSIQRNIRRYYMERKIFQHLLELKSLQIRSNKLNEAVLVKRAVDDYHKSCASLGGETGTRLRRYTFSEYTFKNFELFLYETLKALQKPGTHSFQDINEVYEEAERRLSPDYNEYEKALQCTTKTHRCLHAAHAYTGIPCAAYIPMMNHHTMPKFGFGQYKKAGVGSFYLPKILTGAGGSGGGKVALELSHGRSRQLISLPSDKLDSNKRYYVTFTVKQPGGAAASGADGAAATTATAADKQLSDANCGVAGGEAAAAGK